MTVSSVVFDAYGTLFDVAAAARRAAAEPDCAVLADCWPELAARWRQKQLEYTWLRAITGYHSDFARVTRDALDWTLEAAGIDGAGGLADRLMALYDRLDAYPEVPAMLAALRESGIRTAILSNGTPAMLDAALDSAGLAGAFDAVLSVEQAGTYKPAAAVYDLVEDRTGAPPGETLYVSANGWDVFSAGAYGFRTLWINRSGAPKERIPVDPEFTLPDLSGLPGLVAGKLAEPRPRPPEPLYFQASDGLRLAYRDEGSGTPLLCLAGLSRNMADFDFVARDFADRARIIRLDTRGRGASDHDPDYLNYNLLREGRDALDLLDHLGIEKAAILGTSRGGLIALVLARGHGERLTGVCLNDIGPAINPEGLAFIFGYLGVLPSYRSYEEAADGLVVTTATRFPGVPRSRWRLHAERVWQETPEGLALRYDKNLRRSLLEQSATGTIEDLWPFFDALAGKPVGLIRGEHSDILSAETAAEMRRRRPDMIYAEVPRRGHVPFLDERESRHAVGAFLQAVG